MRKWSLQEVIELAQLVNDRQRPPIYNLLYISPLHCSLSWRQFAELVENVYFLEQIFFRLAAWKFKQFQIFKSNIKLSHARDKVYNAKTTLWIRNTTYVYSLSYLKILFQSVKLTTNYCSLKKKRYIIHFFLLFIYFFCEGRQASEFCSM